MTNKLFSVDDIPRRRFLELGIKGGIALAAAPSLMSCLKKAGEAPPPAKFPLADLNKVIQRALAKGGEFGEVYIENRVSRSVLLEEGKFKSAVYGISRGAGVRVISGDKTGYAYTDDLSVESLLRAADVASYVARGAKAVAPVDIKEEKRPSYVTVKVPLQTVADEKRLEIMKRAHDAALAYDPKVKMASIDYYDEVRGRVIANSEGLYLEDELPLIFFIVQALAVGNDTSHMGRERLSRHAGIEMFDDLKPEDAARDLRPGGRHHARGQGRPGRQDGRGHAERLGRRPRPRGRRAPARGRQHLARDRRLRRQARQARGRPQVHHGRRRHPAVLPRHDQLRRRGHPDEAQRPHPGGHARQVHDRHPVGQTAQDGAHRQRPPRVLPLHADRPHDQHLHREGRRTSPRTSWPRRRAGSTSRA